MKDKNGGQAFPVAGSEQNYPIEGMTLRDYFAAKCMQGDWAAQSDEVGQFCNSVTDQVLEERAMVYYRMADAMLRAREE